MRARAKELKAEAKKADAEKAVLAAIAEMPKPDRALAQRLHDIIKEVAPELSPRTWYGMPAYTKGGKVVCYFKGAHKFETRYAQFGFEDAANLDSGAFWPTVFAITELTASVETELRALVKQAAS
jgi:uncharacterized protein YdhG (YjbR/CyaY superfamily)